MNKKSPAGNFLNLAKMPKEILWYGNPLLHKKTALISAKNIKTQETKDLVKKLSAVLKKIQKLGFGAALAAPQIGILKSAIVLGIDGKYTPFFNSQIIWSSKEKNAYDEGCLSGLPIVARVVRPAKIKVKYHDGNGVLRSEMFDGKMARVFQHEIDHLNGILCIEKSDIKTVRYIFDWDEFRKTAKLVDVK